MTQIFEPQTDKFDNRRASMIVIHGTEVDFDHSHSILTGKHGREASAHYLIDEDGKIIQYLDESISAWHAGMSYWSGFTFLNRASIGIEVVCISKDGSFAGPESVYNAAQMKAVAELCKAIIERHKIPACHILGHEDVAPGRRFDPGVHFDWAALAQEGIGLWHGLEKTAHDPIVTDPQACEAFKMKMRLFGYRPSAYDNKDYSAVIRAFQNHFLPWNVCGQVTQQSIQALDILLERKDESLAGR